MRVGIQHDPSPANAACVVFAMVALLCPGAQASPVLLIKDLAKLKAYYKQLGKGELMAAAGKWEAARTAYRAAISIASEPAAAHHGYQDAMEKLGHGDDVLQQYRDKLRRQPKNARAYYLLARLARDVQEKEKLLKDAARIDPKLHWAHYALGHLYEHTERWPECEAAFKQVIALRPRWPEGRNALGFAYMQQGKDALAKSTFEEVLAANARCVAALVNMSALAMRRKDYGEAVTWCQKALAIEKANPDALNNLGKAYYHQGRLREALKAYRGALQGEGADRPEVVYLNMGFCYYRMREWAQAAAAYDRATALNPEFAYAYYCLAQAKFRQEAHADAWKAVHKAQQLGYEVHERFLKILRQSAAEPERR